MTGNLSASLLVELSQRIAAQMGLHFPPERWPNLEKGLDSAAHELGLASPVMCAQLLRSTRLSEPEIAMLAGHLTVGETYFLRDRQLFTMLEEQLLPQLIRDRRAAGRRLRIWSAGCCTGEEPYSLAILLKRLLPDWMTWTITILATDLNPGFLRKARAGVYREWSFREAPAWLKPRWFHRRANDRYEIVDDIKQAVSFSSLNLAEDTYPSLTTNTSAMDLILCRNVLMYFSHDQALAAGRNLYRSLVDGGWLVVAPSETSQQLFSQFQAVGGSAGTRYRKANAQLSADNDPSRAASGFQPLSASNRPAAAAPVVESPETPLARAAALYRLGRYEDASATLRALCAANGGPPAALALLARSYANQGDLAPAREWTGKAITADKLNAGLHYLLATIDREGGDLEAAVRSLGRALYLDQDFALAHFALGNVTLQQGKPLRARKHFDNTVALLSRCLPGDVVPESDGLTASGLMGMIRMINLEDAP